MSIAVSKEVWARSQARGAARLVLLCLADYADQSGIAWPSIRTVHRKTLVSERQVRRCIARLAAAGEIEIRRKGSGRGRSNIYQILLLPKGATTTGFAERQRGSVKPDKGDISSPRMPSGAKKDEAVTADPSADPMIEPPGNHQITKTPSESRHDPVGDTWEGARKPAEIPESLQTAQFRAAWGAYVQHRREINKPLTSTAEARTLRRLAGVGEQEAIARIDLSIESGWQGLFYPGDEGRFAALRESITERQSSHVVDETKARLLARLKEKQDE